MLLYDITFASEQSDQLDLADIATEKAWPEFMLNYPVANKNWEDLYVKFSASGRYTVDGALVPLTIDKDKNEGLYIEPNILFVHSLNYS